MSCFKKTNDGDEELALACKSEKKKFWSTFVRLENFRKWILLLVDVKQEWFFLGLNLHEFPSVHDKKKEKNAL